MRIYTKTVSAWDGQKYVLQHASFYEYRGTVALADRAGARQARRFGAANQTNAETALQRTNNALGAYNHSLGQYMDVGKAEWAPGGRYMQDINTLGTTAAGAGSRALTGDLLENAMRTGENTAGYAGAIAADRRKRQQELTDELAKADLTRGQQEQEVYKYGVEGSKFPAAVQEQLYGTATNAAANETDAAARAADPLDSTLGAVVGAGTGLLKGFIPGAKGGGGNG